MTSSPGDFPDWILPASAVYTVLLDTGISGAGRVVNCGAFSTLYVLLYNLDNASILSANYRFEAPDVLSIMDQGVLSANATGDRGTCNPVWALPVVGSSVVVEGNGVDTRCKIIGTSKTMPKRLSSDAAPLRIFTGTLAANAPAGTTVNLTSPAGASDEDVPVINCSNYNGEVLYQWASTGANITGDLFCDYLDGFGNLVSVLMFQNFSSVVARLLSGHPFAFVKWRFVSNALNGATPAALKLVIVPASPTN